LLLIFLLCPALTSAQISPEPPPLVRFTGSFLPLTGEEYANCPDFDVANEHALLTTGRAIFFTGTTRVASVIFWVFFPMKFQAEMALLLSLILLFHVIGALVFIPAVVSLLEPRFAIARGRQVAEE
jgi:uncharacterized membrane protein YdfJ with MMPL/SSD domain